MDLIREFTNITNEVIVECTNDSQLSMVAFGQEEYRDLSILLGKYIYIDYDGTSAKVYITDKLLNYKDVPWDFEYFCWFDDEYGNEYYEIEYDGNYYNVPAQFFRDIAT